MLIALLLALNSQPAPEAVAAARDEAQALIEAADAQDLFVEAGADGVPTVRHTASGMTCRFTPGAADNAVIVHPPADGLARGDSVACQSRASGMIVTAYATRYAARVSAEDAVDRAAQAIRAYYPGAVEHTDGFPLLTRPNGDAPPLYTAFSVPTADPPLVTFVLVSHQGEWSYKLRGTRGGSDMGDAAMIGGMMFMNALPTTPTQDAPPDAVGYDGAMSTPDPVHD